MEYIKNNLSDRFFYVRERTPADDGITAAAYDRIFPMSRLQAMCMVDAESLEVSFDDAGVGDHTTVKLLITSGKGREAIKDIVDAINSTQKIVTLGNELTKESVINDFISVEQIAEGAVGTFALNGALTVAGSLGLAKYRVTAATDGLVLTSDHVGVVTVDSSAAKIDLTLPAISGNAGMWYKVILIGTGTESDIRTASSENKIKGQILTFTDNAVPQLSGHAAADRVIFASDQEVGVVLDFWCDGTFWNLNGTNVHGGTVDKTTLTQDS